MIKKLIIFSHWDIWFVNLNENIFYYETNILKFEKILDLFD